MKILIANIFGIGDVLFTTPLISNLKMRDEDIRVDYLCNARARDLLECNPDIDDIFVYEKDDYTKMWQESKGKCLNKLYDLFRGIRRKKYDIVFDFTLSRKFGLFFKTAGISQRVGLDYKHRGLFLTNKVSFNGFSEKHVVEHYLELLKLINIPVQSKNMALCPRDESLEWVSNFLKENKVGDKKLIAVIPGGGASWGTQAFRKRWTVQGFSRATDILNERGYDVVIVGDKSEAEQCEKVAEGMKTKPVFMENSLRLKEYIALLSKCDLVLCNDGGPLHIAAALGVSTVSIFGPVDSMVYGPYPNSEKHKVITAKTLECRPCYNKFKLPECENNICCLTDISPEEVAGACVELLER